MLWYISSISSILIISIQAHAIADAALNAACDQNPSLPQCLSKNKAMGATTTSLEEKTGDEKERFRQAAADRAACIELREEYIKVCAISSSRKVESESKEFCDAYETVCFEISEGEPDQPTISTRLCVRTNLLRTPSNFSYTAIPTSTPVPRRTAKDYTELCREYKQRYLYVCPDPFRFGQKAIIFCPLYAQKCHVPLPDKPVLPTRAPPYGISRSVSSTVDRLCAQYRTFAVTYCNEPSILAQPRYRDACDKYNRFCIRGR
ncbi:unnamed protein product [Enterobius vermicularis]|uniref:DUF725 domain-containing protein n=1 Tax=Enterobius vermicularis TaxID=51028 RepID=A0A0N4VET7_ENTVE|nr:unnamed protein product [Enterobius vermicularis]